MKTSASKNIFSTNFRVIIIAFLLFANSSFAQINNANFIIGDALPDAPALAPRGEFKVGVRTIDFIHTNQVDILHSKEGKEVTYNRPLKVEVWYPAVIPKNKKEMETYHSFLGLWKDTIRPLTPFSFSGRAFRDAVPDLSAGKFPLIIVSHGYPGSRLLLTYLTENLASKGYVVAAIDHTESTYSDRSPFQSTLLNRANDILFVLNQLADLSKSNSNHFLTGLADADNTALIGYSMGGYGVLNAAGAGYSEKIVAAFNQMTGGSNAIKIRTTNNEVFKASYDQRIKAVVAFAPWGMKLGVWDSAGLAGLKVPTFFISGSLDDVSGYEEGTKAIFKGAINADRYLLTYVNARHNIAPNPPPAETLQPGAPFDNYYHYAEPTWNEYRINNINQHFVTAFLGTVLKNKTYSEYLEVPANSNEKTWPGFKARTSTGLELVHATPK
jgi:predicted dienelactone hydrolase